MKINKLLMVIITMISMLLPISLGNAQPSGLNFRPDLEVEIWTNKGEDAKFYRGEDLIAYFRAEQDCYALVYEIDTDGNVNVLFPFEPGGNNFVSGDTVYRIPPVEADYHMEVGGANGDEYIYVIASATPFDAPQWMVYWGYEYEYIEDDWIVDADAGRNETLNRVIGRLAQENGGQYVSDFVRFYVDGAHRHYLYYPASYHNYYYGSCWFGVDYPGCEVFIDGVYYGIAPVYIPSILVGGHVVVIYRYGYPCWQHYFWINHGGYYTYHADINIRYTSYRNNGSRYKYWAEWDFGGKDYKRDKKYKDWGGYTYNHPEKTLKTADSKKRKSYKTTAQKQIKDYSKDNYRSKTEDSKTYDTYRSKTDRNYSTKKYSTPSKSTKSSNTKGYDRSYQKKYDYDYSKKSGSNYRKKTVDNNRKSSLNSKGSSSSSGSYKRKSSNYSKKTATKPKITNSRKTHDKQSSTVRSKNTGQSKRQDNSANKSTKSKSGSSSSKKRKN